MSRGLTVLYDACVLYPNHLRDVLIQLATTYMFRARWTEQIHEEWMRNVLKNYPDISAENLQGLKQKMNQSVSDCLVTDFEYLISSLSLPDPDDRHVLAAAIAAKADVIVTTNLKDFPASVLENYRIEAHYPDDFLADLIDLKPLLVLEAIQAIRTRLKNPPLNFDEYMEILLKQKLPITVSMLRQTRRELAQP